MVTVARKGGFSWRFRRRVLAGVTPAQDVTYAVWAEGTDAIKLGKTDGSPWSRLRALQTSAFYITAAAVVYTLFSGLEYLKANQSYIKKALAK